MWTGDHIDMEKADFKTNVIEKEKTVEILSLPHYATIAHHIDVFKCSIYRVGIWESAVELRGRSALTDCPKLIGEVGRLAKFDLNSFANDSVAITGNRFGGGGIAAAGLILGFLAFCPDEIGERAWSPPKNSFANELGKGGGFWSEASNSNCLLMAGHFGEKKRNL